MSSPFLEDAVEIFFGDGLEIREFFKMPSQNESMRILEGYIRLEADLTLENLI